MTGYMGTVAERVTRGAALLDEQRPGWRGRVAPDWLDIRSGSACVLGQLFGDYVRGLERLGLEVGDGPTFGFNTIPSARGPVSYDELRREWLAQLVRAA